MHSYTVRIELLADIIDYPELGRALAAEGFVEALTGMDGVGYILPTGEYRIEYTPMGLQEVCDLAATVAARFGRNRIFVTSGSRCTWTVDQA